MEEWEQTIDQIYKDTTEPLTMAPRVKRALRAIASGNAHSTDNDKDYSPLSDWTTAFRGAVHCEAMIAIHNFMAVEPEQWHQYKPKFGVSKRCCAGCSLLLNSITGHKSCSTYLGSSNKTWSFTLPSNCPVDVAKVIAKGIDEQLRAMFKTSIEKLETRAAKYVSGGSADESSGFEDAEVDMIHRYIYTDL